MGITDEFLKVGEVRNQICDILNKNSMILTIRNGVIVVERVTMHVNDMPMWVSVYEVL